MEVTDLAHGVVRVIHLMGILEHFFALKQIVYFILAIRVTLRNWEEPAESLSTSISSCIV